MASLGTVKLHEGLLPALRILARCSSSCIGSGLFRSADWRKQNKKWEEQCEEFAASQVKITHRTFPSHMWLLCTFWLTWLKLSLYFYFVYHIDICLVIFQHHCRRFPVSKQKSDPLYLRICRGAAVEPGPSPRAAIRNISFQDNWAANTFGTNGLKMRILTWILDTLPFFQLQNLPTGVCWAHLHHEISSWFLSSEFGHIFYQSGTPAKYIE